jgi:hypothetical protein
MPSAFADINSRRSVNPTSPQRDHDRADVLDAVGDVGGPLGTPYFGRSGTGRGSGALFSSERHYEVGRLGTLVFACQIGDCYVGEVHLGLLSVLSRIRLVFWLSSTPDQGRWPAWRGSARVWELGWLAPRAGKLPERTGTGTGPGSSACACAGGSEQEREQGLEPVPEQEHERSRRRNCVGNSFGGQIRYKPIPVPATL